MGFSLITGGAGFIGSHLCRALLEQGERVRVIDNLSTGRIENLEPLLKQFDQLDFHEASITSATHLNDALQDVDTIYHLAAAVGVKLVAEDPVRTIETNIAPTELLLKVAAVRHQKVFLASTSEVYGKNPNAVWSEEDDLCLGPTSRPRWAYGCSKAIDEFLALAYARQHNLPVVIGRFFNVVGPGQVGNYGMVIPRFIDKALAGENLTVYDDGLQERCFAHVDEVVRCILKLMQTPSANGLICNIGGNESITMRALAEKVISKIDPALSIDYIPYQDVYGADFEDVRCRVPDLSRLESLIQDKPTRSLDEILEAIIAWKRSQ
ncbi:MAG: NAD-dependent epimerase/dehydratase family protein [Planctomycetaceae bacterium]|nr:NAD-dependent epimerase/dehydratase family protein [Planctomycetaceae bacterium]